MLRQYRLHYCNSIRFPRRVLVSYATSVNTTKFLKLHEALDLILERDRQRLIGDDGEYGDPLAMAAAAQDSGFDKLFSKNVLLIQEQIFLSLDYESYKTWDATQ